MITEAKNKKIKNKKEPEKKLSPAERKEMLRTRYGIGKQPQHYGANR